MLTVSRQLIIFIFHYFIEMMMLISLIFWKVKIYHRLFIDSNDLFNIVERNNTNSFNAGIGKLFVLVDERNEKEFNETLCMLREQQIGPLSAVSMEAGGGSYQRGYEYVVNLHALQEIESCMQQLLNLRNDTSDKEHYRNSLIKNLDSYLISPWEHRVQTMQPSFKVWTCSFMSNVPKEERRLIKK